MSSSALSREILSSSFASSSSSLQLASSFVFKPEPIDIRVTFPKTFLYSKVELSSFTVSDLLNTVRQEIKTDQADNSDSKLSLIPTDEDGVPMEDLPTLSKTVDIRTVGASEFVIIDAMKTPLLYVRLVVADGLDEATDFFDCDDDDMSDDDTEMESVVTMKENESSLGTLLLMKQTGTVGNTCDITETTSTCSSSKAGRTVSSISHVMLDYSRSRNREKSVSYPHIERERKGGCRYDDVLPDTIVIKLCYPTSDVWNDFKTVVIANKDIAGKRRSLSEPRRMRTPYGSDTRGSTKPLDFYESLHLNIDDSEEDLESGYYYYEEGNDSEIVVEGRGRVKELDVSTSSVASDETRSTPVSTMFFSDFEI